MIVFTGISASNFVKFFHYPNMQESVSFRGKRLFLAIELPDYLRESLSHLREDLRGFHWVSPERLHLTLKYIGDVPGQFQLEIEEILDQVEVRRFMLPVKGVGRFPDKGNPHAVWAGVGSGHPHLFQLQKRIDDALFNLGIDPERHVYQPHITLARVNQASAESVRQYLKRHESFEAAPFHVEKFHLYHSDMLDGKRVHQIEKSWELASPLHSPVK